MASQNRFRKPSWPGIALLLVPLLAPIGCGGEEDTGSESGALTAPTDVKAEVLPGPAVHLTWKDTPSEHHYSIQRKEGAGAWSEISTTTFDVTQYHDAAVEAGKSYSYRVAGADKDAKAGPFSAEVTTTVN